MEKVWYIIYDGRQVGPMPAEDLLRYGLMPESMVWTPGMTDWRPASECEDLVWVMQNNQASRERVDTARENRGPHRIPDPENPGNWKFVNEAPGAEYASGAGAQSVRNGYADYRQYPGGHYEGWSGKSNIVAGLLSILLGYLGVQYFYIGKVTAGLLTILLSLVTCGAWSIITLIQGIYMLTLPEWEFDRKYVYTRSSFPIF